ncbi:hypothetical protein BD779DRAFT_1671929 [Infundibulicybe gibba]|nr:hypothetical protein BD779DRAFT_1809253 [Infundibulicybe gibba]KAF8889383.1 hypothetical protein BD779DRAFT_1671929 [Infundibulicybe gibba]
MSHTISTSTLMLLVAPRHHSPSLYIASSRYHIPICPRRLLTPSAAIVSPPCNAHASSSCPRMLPVTLSLTTTPRRFIHVASNVTAVSLPSTSQVQHSTHGHHHPAPPPSFTRRLAPLHPLISPASLPAYPLASLHSPATSSVVSPSRPPTHLVCSRVPIPDPAPRSRVLSRVLFSVVAARNRDIFLWYLIALGPVAFSSGLYS